MRCCCCCCLFGNAVLLLLLISDMVLLSLETGGRARVKADTCR